MNFFLKKSSQNMKDNKKLFNIKKRKKKESNKNKS